MAGTDPNLGDLDRAAVPERRDQIVVQPDRSQHLGRVLADLSRAAAEPDVLRVGHHGNLATSTSPAWAQILSPLASVFSAGYQNTYGHPRREVVERLLPFAQSVPAHAFRDWRAGEAPGPRYVVRDEPAMTKAVYATASSRTVVVKTTGAGCSTTFGN